MRITRAGFIRAEAPGAGDCLRNLVPHSRIKVLLDHGRHVFLECWRVGSWGVSLCRLARRACKRAGHPEEGTTETSSRGTFWISGIFHCPTTTTSKQLVVDYCREREIQLTVTGEAKDSWRHRQIQFSRWRRKFANETRRLTNAVTRFSNPKAEFK